MGFSRWPSVAQCSRVLFRVCAMAGEWPGVFIALCVVDLLVLGQVSHVDPVGFTSHEGTRCYDHGRPQVSRYLALTLQLMEIFKSKPRLNDTETCVRYLVLETKRIVSIQKD